MRAMSTSTLPSVEPSLKCTRLMLFVHGDKFDDLERKQDMINTDLLGARFDLFLQVIHFQAQGLEDQLKYGYDWVEVVHSIYSLLDR